MKQNYLLIIFLLCSAFVFSQQERIEISGQIAADSLEVEGINIYNTVTGLGTISDEEGNFKINVFLNDKIEITGLQFQKINLTISEDIIKTKQVSIVLIERINNLPEVVILPYGLTGALKDDIANAKILKPDYESLNFALANAEDFEFLEDAKDGVESATPYGYNFYNGVDFVGIFNTFLSPIFKSKKKKELKSTVTNNQLKRITDKYSETYLVERLNIPKKKLKKFLYFVEDGGFDANLLSDSREIDFLEFMLKEYTLFLENETSQN